MTQDASLEQLRAQTAKYAKDASFISRWSGLSIEDVHLRATQQRAFVELLAPVCKHLGNLAILDVGCGAARWLRWYLELGAEVDRVQGVDVSDVRFDEARRINPAVRLTMIDGQRLPFEDGTFDLVTQWVCFMCIPDEAWRHRLAKEMLRVLRPGGHIYWWDTPKANASLTDGRPIEPATFFPGLGIERREVSAGGLPSHALRKGPVKRWIGPVLDRVAAPPPTHVAARIGPKR